MAAGPDGDIDFLNALYSRLPLKAISVIHFGGGDPTTNAAGGSADDSGVLFNWTVNAANHAPAEVKAHTGAVLWAIFDDGIAEVATWGNTDAACRAIGAWGGQQLKALPICPWQTWYGWGNGGDPKPLSEAAYAGLTEQQRAYVDRNTR